MATNYFKFRGKARFIKIYEPDDFMGAKNYKAGIYPADESEWEKFRQSGIQKTVKEDDQGKYFEVTRAETRTFGDEVRKFSPPIVYGKDGAVLVSYINEDSEIVRSWQHKVDKAPSISGERILIGNGSEVEVTVAVFDTRKGKGQRLESVKILDLIEYKKPETLVDADPEVEEVTVDQSYEEKDTPVPVKKPKGKAPW